MVLASQSKSNSGTLPGISGVLRASSAPQRPNGTTGFAGLNLDKSGVREGEVHSFSICSLGSGVLQRRNRGREGTGFRKQQCLAPKPLGERADHVQGFLAKYYHEKNGSMQWKDAGSGNRTHQSSTPNLATNQQCDLGLSAFLFDGDTFFVVAGISVFQDQEENETSTQGTCCLSETSGPLCVLPVPPPQSETASQVLPVCHLTHRYIGWPHEYAISIYKNTRRV